MWVPITLIVRLIRGFWVRVDAGFWDSTMQLMVGLETTCHCISLSFKPILVITFFSL